jgi:signal transduction histidine kinase
MAGPVNDTQKQFLSTIQFNTERLSILIRDLLDIGRIETGRLKMELSPVAIKSIIEETIRSLQSQISERQIGVELHLPDELPTVLADRARLIQILTNLVSNAYKYTPTSGKMTITVSRLKEIQPRDAPRGNWTRTDVQQLKPNPAGYLACAVKDTGIGIAPDDQAKLFTQFFRSQNPAVREQRGTGLGLAITKSLIELQGGAIWVDSELEKGSTFSFSLPIVENGERAQAG